MAARAHLGIPLVAGIYFALAATPAPAVDDMAASGFRVPVRAFAAEARGPFQTGTIEELWIDTARDELSTSDPTDKRHLMVQVWYPASFKGDPVRAPYALRRELYPHDASMAWLDAAAAVRTNSVLNAPLAAGAGPFPVLVYGPGAGYPHFSGTFQTEFLASHGYVVISVGHTDVSRIERFPDGYVYQRDRNIPAVSAEQRQALSATDLLKQWVGQISELEIPVHVADISYALDRLQLLNERRDSIFYRRLDLSRVGALGWSLGGAASLQASYDEPRIKAAVNLDGRLYIKAADTGTHRPILQMHGNKQRPADPGPAGMEAMLVGDSLFWRMYSRTDAGWYDLILRGATHRHFSDLTLFEAADPALLYPRLAHEIVNRYVLEFFDKYLRDSANTPLLSGARSWPEVEFVSHQVQP